MWPILVLIEPISERLRRRAPFAHDRAERLDLDRIAERRARAMCFDIVDVAGVKPGLDQRAFVARPAGRDRSGQSDRCCGHPS